MSAGPEHLTAVVGVCDEVEIIGRCLDHLERQGVDSIVVVDMESRDGTRELLRAWRDAGRIALVERSNDSNINADYLQAGVDCARRHWDPTWILLQDADEFCLTASGNLKQAISGRCRGAFHIPRYNACLSSSLVDAFDAPGTLAFEAIDIWVAPQNLSRDKMNEDPDLLWSTGQPAPKVIAAAELVGSVTPGGHAILDRHGSPVPIVPLSDALIVHIPFLSFPRFARKISRVKDVLARDRSYFQRATGWHWRRWVEMLDAGTLEEEYDRQLMDSADFAAALRFGAVRRAEAQLVLFREGAKSDRSGVVAL
ncbi:hypothetical protein RHAL1_00371 [Beijerinckiaceae bacterium RH AL1]|nr:glycosyltransferase family 2 protein [Beijerinckiaceae bacterium]VVB42763.1 hypothetical protein RHAL8_00351 [Beijerinckiaceae bacterium RH AL8]VVB42773.1 hypothetical protein RHCH11_RHCH11_00353 [Beijerinckiaceae bacterium RH CH11]VVC53490.1 hypothetical protein RHAL1_00371 [Beijerinckiaceae bacterium RH AL1]